MSNKTYIYFFALMMLIFTSCEESINIDNSSIDEIEKLVIECELSPSRRIEAKVYSMSDFSKLNAIKYPKDLTIELGTSTDVAYFFQYEEKTGTYFIDPAQYDNKLNLSFTYKLKAYDKKDKSKYIYAETVVPQIQHLSLSDSKVILSDINSSKGIKQKKIMLPLTISQTEKAKSFYRLKVYRNIYQTVNGEFILTGKTEELKFEGNDELPLAFTNSAFDGCLLFDASRLESKKLELNFSTKNFLDGDKLNTVYYELEALTESVYRYQIAKSKQINAALYGLSDPVINYTNIEGGKGYFGSSIMTSDSIVISK